MLRLLLALAGAEIVVAYLLSSQIESVLKLGQKIVNWMRCSRSARIVVKSLTGAIVARLASTLRSTLISEDELVTQSLLLEITLTCFVLILLLILSSFDHSLKRAEGWKQQVDSLKKQLEGAQTDYIRLQDEVITKAAKEEKGLAAEVKSQKEIIFDLRQKLEQVQVDLNAKEKELKSVTTNFRALEKQANGFQDEYMRVVDESKNLRNQLSFFDRKYAGSVSKKNS